MGRHFKRSSALCKYRMQGWDPTMLAYIKYGERERACNKVCFSQSLDDEDMARVPDFGSICSSTQCSRANDSNYAILNRPDSSL